MGRANRLVEGVALGRVPTLTERARATLRNVGGEIAKQVKDDVGAVKKPFRIEINPKGK
jgi:hypothetical protein